MSWTNARLEVETVGMKKMPTLSSGSVVAATVSVGVGVGAGDADGVAVGEGIRVAEPLSNYLSETHIRFDIAL